MDEIPPRQTGSAGVPPAPRTSPNFCSGISLVELLITLGVIAVLAGIAVTVMSGLRPQANLEVATDAMNFVNRAVLHYTQAGGPIDVDSALSAADETEVITLLKTRDLSLPGSPLVPDEFPDSTSNSTELYRIQWTGKLFQLLQPGEAGAGIVVAN